MVQTHFFIKIAYIRLHYECTIVFVSTIIYSSFLFSYETFLFSTLKIGRMCRSYIYESLFILLMVFTITSILVHIGSISNTMFMFVHSKILSNISCSNCKCIALINSSVAWNCLVFALIYVIYLHE